VIAHLFGLVQHSATASKLVFLAHLLYQIRIRRRGIDMATTPTRSLQEAADHYRELRSLTYELIESEYPAFGLSCKEISLADARQGDLWTLQWSDPQRRPIWSWEAMFQTYRGKAGIKRFDLAVKSAGQLRGLCYGVPNNSKLVLKIHAIARAPAENPLRGTFFRMAIFGAAAYAKFLGSQEIWLVDPLNESVVHYYMRFGFTPERDRHGTITHLVRPQR
jgi:hypothetical protein